VHAKDIGGKGRHVSEREAVTLHPQSNYPEKIFMIERLRLVQVEGERSREGGAQEGDREYRLGYYVVSRRGDWAWWQYAPFIPVEDF
jgi:hypothetical protein